MQTYITEHTSKIEVVDSLVFEGDALTVLRRLPDECVQLIVTSPPDWGLRDYKFPAHIGLEPTLGQFLDSLRQVFSEAKRVLRNDGVMWLNIGEGYKGIDYHALLFRIWRFRNFRVYHIVPTNPGKISVRCL